MYGHQELINEGDIEVCGIVVLCHFSYGFMVFLIKNCSIAVLSSTTVHGFSRILSSGVLSNSGGVQSNFVWCFGEERFLTMTL